MSTYTKPGYWPTPHKPACQAVLARRECCSLGSAMSAAFARRCSELDAAPLHARRSLSLVFLVRNPECSEDLALVILLDRLTKAGWEPQLVGIDGHGAAFAPVAHEPFQMVRLDRIHPAPALEPRGQDLS